MWCWSLEAEKFFCWTLFRHNVPCQFFFHLVYLFSAAYIGMTDQLINYPTGDKIHMNHHKTLAHATFWFLISYSKVLSFDHICHLPLWCHCSTILSQTLKSTSVSVCFRGISRLPSTFVFLRWFKLAHISIQVCTFHDGCKQGIDQQIFNRKSISRKITHPQSKHWGKVVM